MRGEVQMQSDFFHGKNSDTWDSRQEAMVFLPRFARADAARHAPLPIADMADLFGVTHRTLHFYEEKRLIRAERLGTMRVYDAENIRRMAVICACREIGISLAAIQDLMEELSDVRTQDEADSLFQRALEARKREITADLSSINRQIQQIRTLIERTDVLAGVPVEHRPSISDLERRCLILMTEGFGGRDLAERLGMDMEALARLEDDLMEKLGASNRFQAAAKAVMIGILPH